MKEPNVVTDFSPTASTPLVDPTSYVHPLAAVIGKVIIGKHVMVSPMASVRGDEGQPLFIGDASNIQDGVIIHALETYSDSVPVEKNLREVEGEKYAVYVGKRVSLAHQVQIHGPAVVFDDTFVGMKSLVFRSVVGQRCVIEPGCIIMGVEIPSGRYVPAGSVVTAQNEADRLPEITGDYALKDMNKGVVHVNTSLAKAYLEARE